MNIEFNYQKEKYKIDLSQSLDISIPLIPGSDAPNCFWSPLFDAAPVKSGDWIGDVNAGGSVNFKNVQINPHGNGTHTECVGHIAKETVTINSVLKKFHHVAKVISIYPQTLDDNDKVITVQQISDILGDEIPDAIVIRTMPNGIEKRKRIYSGTNPPYIHHDAIRYMVDRGIKHLLLDLPSVDREEDGGKLLAHKAFWEYPRKIDMEKTISEMIFVDNAIPDGLYLLNLQIASFEIDVSPSKPVLYRMKKI